MKLPPYNGIERVLLQLLLAPGRVRNLVQEVNHNNVESINSLKDGGMVLSNHTDNWDPLLVGHSLLKHNPDMNLFAIAKHGLAESWVFQNIPHVLGVIRSKDRKKKGISKEKAYEKNLEIFKKAGNYINNGATQLLFPQGTRVSKDDKVVFQPWKLEGWLDHVDSSKPILLTNITYGSSVNITYSGPLTNYKSVEEVIDFSKEFYNS